MKDVAFQANGDRLSINIVFGYAQIASYRLRIWESESNTVVLDKSGNNQNPDDDCYNLPLPTRNNDGRLIQCETSILSPDPKPDERYSVTLIFTQGNNEIDRMKESGPMNGSRVTPELWATLRAR